MNNLINIIFIFDENCVLQSNDFTFPLEFTIFFLVKSYDDTNDINLDFGKNTSSFSIKLSGIENSIQITNSISLSDNDVIRKVILNISSKIELWTIRVRKTSSNFRRIEILKGLQQIYQ